MYGSWHLGRLQVGLSRAIRLAQCHSCRITAREALAVQIDGEPWLQPPCSLDIALKGQVRLLRNTPALRSVQSWREARRVPAHGKAAVGVIPKDSATGVRDARYLSAGLRSCLLHAPC